MTEETSAALASGLQVAITLAGPLLPHALIYLTGSHMFGLQTPDSDADYTVIYFDPADDRRIFRQHPEVLHSDGNDQKLYSLRKWAELLTKGNPNICEMVNLTNETLGEVDGMRFWNSNRFRIRRFFDEVRPHVATQSLAAAYVGHLQGLLKELATGKYDSGRTAHGFRVAYSAVQLLETGCLPDFRDMSEQLATTLAVKTEQVGPDWASYELRGLNHRLGELYAVRKHDLQTNASLRDAINQFFVEVHA